VNYLPDGVMPLDGKVLKILKILKISR